jgi:Leucine-rich repeat (LRR) protein
LIGELECLNLTGNKLAALPNNLAELGKLQELSLYRNQFTVIPDVIGQLLNI